MKLHRIALTVVAVIAVATSGRGASSPIPDPDTVAMQAFLSRFADCYERQDVDGLMALWDPTSPEYDLRRSAMQCYFANESFQLKWTLVRSLGKATVAGRLVLILRADIDLTSRLKPGALAVGESMTQPVVHHLERDFLLVNDGSLKIWHYGPTGDAMAAAVLARGPMADVAAGLGAEASRMSPTIATSLYELGRRVAHQGNYRVGELFLKSSLSFARQKNDWPSIVLIDYEMAESLRNSGHYKESIAHYQEALKPVNGPVWVGALDYGLGLSYLHLGQDDRAIRTLNAARTALAHTNATWWKGLVEVALAQVSAKSNPLRAYYALRRALVIYDTPGFDLARTRAQLRLADVCLTLDRYRQAIFLYQTASDRFQAWGYREYMAECQLGLGLCLLSEGSYSEARLRLQKTLDYFTGIANESRIADTAEALAVVEDALSGSGNRGLHARAVNHLQIARRHYLRVGNQLSGLSATGRLTVMRQRVAPGAPRAPIERFSRLAADEGVLGHPLRVCNALRLLAFRDTRSPIPPSDRTLLAVVNDMHARALAQKDPGWTSVSWLNLASIYFRAHDLSRAIASAATAARYAGLVESRELKWRSLSVEGEALAAAGRDSEALQALRAAADVLDELRPDVGGGEEELLRFGQDKAWLYEDILGELIRLRRQSAELPMLLEYAERMKGRFLLDSLRQVWIPLARRASAADWASYERHASSTSTIVVVSARRNGAKTATLTTAPSLSVADAFRRTLSLYYGPLPKSSGQPAGTHRLTLTQGQALSLVPDTHSALLEFAVLPHDTLLLVITRSHSGTMEIHRHLLPISAAGLKKRVDDLRDAITGYDSGHPLIGTEDGMERDMFRLVLAPAVELKGKTALTIVPDGPLWRLPFQALIPPQPLAGRPRYVADTSAVAYAYSLRWLWEIRHRPPLGRAPVDLLTAGDPAGGDREHHRDLRSIIASYGRRSRTLITRHVVSPSGLFGAADAARIIHVATEGRSSERDPFASRLEMSPQGPAGFVTARDLILRLRLTADVVTVAACESAQGRELQGEGTVGIAWAFLLTGARAVIASQWDVPIPHTDALMTDIHRRIAQQITLARPTTPLSQITKESMCRQGHSADDPEPYFWAGFIVIGDAGPIPRRSDKMLHATHEPVLAPEPSDPRAIRASLGVTAEGVDNPYSPQITAPPGASLGFKVYLENAGFRTAKSPRITVALDPQLEYIPESSRTRIDYLGEVGEAPITDSFILFQGHSMTWLFDDKSPNPGSALYLMFEARIRLDAKHTMTGFPVTAYCSFNGSERANSAKTPGVVVNSARVIVGTDERFPSGVTISEQAMNLTLTKWKTPWEWRHNNPPTVASAGDRIRLIVSITNTRQRTTEDLFLRFRMPPLARFIGRARIYDSDSRNGRSAPGLDPVQTGITVRPIRPGRSVEYMFDIELAHSAASIPFALLFQSELAERIKKALSSSGPTERIIATDDSTRVIVCPHRGLYVIEQAADPKTGALGPITPYLHDSGHVFFSTLILNNSFQAIRGTMIALRIPPQLDVIPKSLKLGGAPLNDTFAAWLVGAGMPIGTYSPGYTRHLDFSLTSNGLPLTRRPTTSCDVRIINNQSVSLYYYGLSIELVAL